MFQTSMLVHVLSRRLCAYKTLHVPGKDCELKLFQIGTYVYKSDRNIYQTEGICFILFCLNSYTNKHVIFYNIQTLWYLLRLALPDQIEL